MESCTKDHQPRTITVQFKSDAFPRNISCSSSKQYQRCKHDHIRVCVCTDESGVLKKTLEVVEVIRSLSRWRVPDCVFCIIVKGFSRKIRGFRSMLGHSWSFLLVILRIWRGQLIRIFCHCKCLSSDWPPPGRLRRSSQTRREGLAKRLVTCSNMISNYGKMGKLGLGTGNRCPILEIQMLKGLGRPCRLQILECACLKENGDRGRSRSWGRKEAKWSRVVPDRVSHTYLP